MKLTFYDNLVFFQWGCMVASAIFSLKLIGNKSIPRYMNNFYWYSLVAGTTGIYGFLHIYINISSETTFSFIYDSLLLFHFIFLSLFIYRVLPNRNHPVYIKFIFFLFLFAILFYLFTNRLSKREFIAFAISNFGLILFCCYYYFQLFKKMSTIALLKEPSFWIINGIFFCMCATMPLISLRGYLFDHIPYKLYLSMGGIAAAAYGVMHLFFIKAYLCSINRSNRKYQLKSESVISKIENLELK